MINVKIEELGLNIWLPTTEEITIGVFQKISHCESVPHVISVLAGGKHSQVEIGKYLTVKQVRIIEKACSYSGKWAKKHSGRKEYKIGGKKFALIKSIDDMNFGEFCDVEEFLSSNIVPHLHTVCSYALREKSVWWFGNKLTKPDEVFIRNRMRLLDALDVVSFFLTNERVLQNISLNYSRRTKKKKEKGK